MVSKMLIFICGSSYKIIEKQISQKQKEEAADLVINTEMNENLLKVELIKFVKEIL